MSSKQVGTDRQIAALKPGEKPYECSIDGSRGLRIRVFPAGTKQFEFRYTALGGARRRHLLGAYPDLSLAEARTRAATLRVRVADGVDPAAERAAKKERARTGETMRELAEAYWKAAAVGLHGGSKRPKRASTIATERKCWRHVESKLGSKRFTDVRRADIKIFMRDLVTSSGLSAATIANIGAVVQSVLGFAVHEERLDANPAIGLARPLAVTSRDRMFSDDALGIILRAAIDASVERPPERPRDDKPARMRPALGLAIRLLMLTLARRSEIAGSRWEEFDLKAKLWTIPSARAKAKHMHVVPLTCEMIAVLEAIQRLHANQRYLFPSSGSWCDHMDPHAITRAFARISARHKLGPGSPHDVRRSGATTLVGRYGVSRLVVGLLLGHTSREGAVVTSVYDRHTYIPEKRAALEQWNRHLAALG
jgi:integrase